MVPKKARAKSKVEKGHEGVGLSGVSKFSGSKISKADTRIKLARAKASLRKRGRVSTTGFKTTDAVDDLNAFLAGAGFKTSRMRFEGGHLIADVLGGPTSTTNVVPMPHTVNTKTFKSIEHDIRTELAGRTPSEAQMEVDVSYSADDLEGFLTSSEQTTLDGKVGAAKMGLLRQLFKSVPDWMSVQLEDAGGGGRKYWDLKSIRNDIWPWGEKPADVFDAAYDLEGATNRLT